MKKNYGILPAENFEHRTVRPTQAPPAYLSFLEVRDTGGGVSFPVAQNAGSPPCGGGGFSTAGLPSRLDCPREHRWKISVQVSQRLER